MTYAKDVRGKTFYRHARAPDAGGPAVFAKEVTESSKLGPVSATYAAQVTCPGECPLRNAGCYAETGPIAMITTRRLNLRAEGRHAEAVALEEAEAIDRLSATRDLRLHIVGDCPNIISTLLVASAACRYIDRAPLPVKVWTYTHAWRRVPRSAWMRVSVFASCETPADVKLAEELGYAAAIMVDEHHSVLRHERDGVSMLPCPEQTRGVQCVDCRLCLDADALHERGMAIAFAVHGDRAGKSRAARTLESRNRT